MSLASWFLSKLEKKDIGNGAGQVFFWRYHLLKTRWLGIYLHEFVRSDHDRCLHDHPWGFVAVIIRGGYMEQMADGYYWRRPGSILWRPAKTAHRIEIPYGSRPWSLVFVGRKVRDCGFYTKDGWRKNDGVSPLCETDA